MTWPGILVPSLSVISEASHYGFHKFNKIFNIFLSVLTGKLLSFSARLFMPVQLVAVLFITSRILCDNITGKAGDAAGYI